MTRKQKDQEFEASEERIAILEKELAKARAEKEAARAEVIQSRRVLNDLLRFRARVNLYARRVADNVSDTTDGIVRMIRDS